MEPTTHRRSGTRSIVTTGLAALALTATLATLAALAGSASPAAANPANSLFLEVGGAGGFYSLNYERFVSPSVSLRGGAGYLWVWPSIPLTATWFVGEGTHRLELGAGAVLFLTPSEDKDDANVLEDLIEDILIAEGRGTQVVGTATAGYRLTSGRFLLRLAFTPYWKGDEFVPWAGASLGLAF